ncbi:hypothetical protein HZS_1850 [Henneguya salminicola]|nr:hypothetical protein HZS_1850 [Henneguya salminicola]
MCICKFSNINEITYIQFFDHMLNEDEPIFLKYDSNLVEDRVKMYIYTDLDSQILKEGQILKNYYYFSRMLLKNSFVAPISLEISKKNLNTHDVWIEIKILIDELFFHYIFFIKGIFINKTFLDFESKYPKCKILGLKSAPEFLAGSKNLPPTNRNTARLTFLVND